jgi:hypothetical protein
LPNPDSFGQVSCEYGAAQPVSIVVRILDDILLGGEFDHPGCRAKYLLSVDLHFLGHTRKDGGHDNKALVERRIPRSLSPKTSLAPSSMPDLM